MTYYIWFPTSKGSIDLSDNEGTIYTDMMKYVVSSVWGSENTQINGRRLGDVINLPEEIRNFPNKVDENYEDNVNEAKQIFLNQLTQLKETSLKKALKDMEYTKGQRLGNYEDITLNEMGDKLREFKMQPVGTSETRRSAKKIMGDTYIQSFEDFLTPIDGDVVSNYVAKPVEKEGDLIISFTFNMVYKETKQDNENELKTLGVNQPEYEKMNTTFTLDGILNEGQQPKITETNEPNPKRITALTISKWHRAGHLNHELKELIYYSIRHDIKQQAILNPKYVTSFTISGEYSGNVRNEKQFKLAYSGEGNTTSKVTNIPISSESFEPRAFTRKPTSDLPVPSVPETQASQNIILTYRVDLIEKIQANIKKLESAIRSLT